MIIMIILKAMLKLNNLLELQQELISSNHKYLMMILDLSVVIIGYNLYAFDVRYQHNFAASQPI